MPYLWLKKLLDPGGPAVKGSTVFVENPSLVPRTQHTMAHEHL